jgi:two-component system cell cycle response regulator DivK
MDEQTRPTPTSGIFTKPLILYIEDDLDTRGAYAALLRRAGFRVAEARNGVEGVESALDLKPDLVLLDLSLPVVDGYEAMRRIKKTPKTAHIPVVVLSGFALREEARPYCDGFLSKPHDVVDLVRIVNEVLATRAPQKNTIAKTENGGR